MGPANINHTRNAMEANPYSTPAANLYGTNTSGGNVVSAGTIAQLAGTKGWVRFMSVLMWLGAIFVIGGIVLILVAGSAGLAQMSGMGSREAGMLVGMMIPYAIMAFMMMYPATKMWKYANCIGRLMASHSVADLDAALTEQRRYWKFNGILVIIGLCLGVVGFIAGAAMSFSAMKSGSVGM